MTPGIKAQQLGTLNDAGRRAPMASPSTQGMWPGVIMKKKRRQSKVISGLIPFNEVRFRAVMALLSKRHDTALDIYRLVKFHALIDILHVLKTGKAVIGGSLHAWALGPVSPPAYQTVNKWFEAHNQSGVDPEPFEVIEPSSRYQYDRLKVVNPDDVDEDDFSQTEIEVVDEAWKTIGKMTFAECREFFHSESSFIGAVWKQAREKHREIDWRDIIASYEKQHGGDHRIAKLAVAI